MMAAASDNLECKIGCHEGSSCLSLFKFSQYLLSKVWMWAMVLIGLACGIRIKAMYITTEPMVLVC
eukprot:m.148534 g.148534  ORF g.148534 m.148534 type:complete len:66 (+) comp15000_c0_seq1:255-452(+)